MDLTISNIIKLINTDNFYKAELELRKIYNNNPHSFDLNKLLGLSLLAQRKYNSALKCFERCYSKKKDDYDVVLNLSFIFCKIQFYEQSIEYSQKAIELIENRPQAYQNLATSYFMIQKYDQSESACLKSIDLRGGKKSKNFLDAEDLVVLYCDILLATDRKEELVSFICEVLEEKYIQKLLIRLLREDRSKITNKHIEQANNAINESHSLEKKIDRNTRESDACFFLAEYYALQDKSRSEEYYFKANKLISDMQRESLYLRQKYTKSIYEYFKLEDTSEIEKNIDPKKGEGLIFILGMPRSGTSLIESILSTADNLKTGGEKAFFSIQLYETITNMMGDQDNSINLNLDFYKDLGDRYLEHINIQKGQNYYFVDKLPENYLFLKFISLSLPGAKFIHCYRDPWDNAISLFKQNYSINIFYASSFFGIATEIANYEFLMSFWNKHDILKDKIFNLKYEDLITNQTKLTNDIWNYFKFKGAYDPNARKNHFAYTASMQQVSKEIYETSIKKDDFSTSSDSFVVDLENQRQYWKNKLQ